jgi:hypothetical protein
MAKAKELTDKQEAACQAYIECGGNQSEAYRRAYNAENMKPETIWVKASELFANGNVAGRVLELQAIHAERHNVTVDSITKELDEAKDLAKECEQPAAMTGAIMGKAKIHGLVTDKKELTGKDGAPIEAAFNFIPVNSKTGD